MKILFLGDVMGRAAREAVLRQVPLWRKQWSLDFVIINGENAAGGFGITPAIAEAFFDVGVDVISTGNHVWDQQEIQGYIETERRLLRPVNFPTGTPGIGANLYQAGERQVMVINVMGQLFMETLDDPFVAVERELSACPLGEMADAIIVDFHAEATSEKMALGHLCDGRASLVIGTHTHVPTADAQVLPGGTAYQTDAGMCGDYDSVIGMAKDEPLKRFVTKLRGGRYTPAQGTPTLCGAVVETDDKTGLATEIAPVRFGGRLSSTAMNG
ncbi:MAG: TIGR00282 family metallophosphoesterase [PS1 clade bacterium]|nr:TIGR00282 family metallophosphoesterase [PS1 clade bacterium]